MVSVTGAAELAGVPAGTIRNALDRGDLVAAHTSPEGYRFVRPADVLAWAPTRSTRGQARRPAAASV
jgi:hypothetical protein